MRRIYRRLTVGELRKALANCPDEALVLIDFQTEYDGTEVERQGTATWADFADAAVPHLRIDATEENRDDIAKSAKGGSP